MQIFLLEISGKKKGMYASPNYIKIASNCIILKNVVFYIFRLHNLPIFTPFKRSRIVSRLSQNAKRDSILNSSPLAIEYIKFISPFTVTIF